MEVFHAMESDIIVSSVKIYIVAIFFNYLQYMLYF